MHAEHVFDDCLNPVKRAQKKSTPTRRKLRVKVFVEDLGEESTLQRDVEAS